MLKEILFKNGVYKKIKDYFKHKSFLNVYFEVEKLLAEAQGGETRAQFVAMTKFLLLMN